MSKETITFDDLLTCLDMMNGNFSVGDILNKIDPSVSSEELYYYHERLLFYKKSSKERISFAQAAAVMLREEKVTRPVVALAMFGYCNFYSGHKQSVTERQRKDDKIADALDKLAADLGGNVEIVKVNFEKNGEEKEN